jgi:hypothetical protein
MKKGKSSALILLIIEIATITVLHAVKINHSGKTASKELSKDIYSAQPETKTGSAFSVALYK